MPSRCFEFVDSRLRRSPPDRASAVPMDKLGKRNAFPPPCPQVGGCPQASQQPQQRCDNFVSGNDQPSSRLPAFSLFFPGSCPNNRDRRTETLCRRAIAIAPSYAQAHSLLAWLLVRRSLWAGAVGPVLPEATAEARTALRLDERDPWAHMTYGQVLLRTRRYREAERALRRALELNPNFALAYAFLGLPLAHQGASEEAIKTAEHALRLSPSDPLIGAYGAFAMANARFVAEQYDHCVTAARSAIERYPEFRPLHHLLVAAAALQGDMEAATEALPNLLRLRPGLSLSWLSANMTYGGEIGARLLDGLRKAGLPEE